MESKDKTMLLLNVVFYTGTDHRWIPKATVLNCNVDLSQSNARAHRCETNELENLCVRRFQAHTNAYPYRFSCNS